MHFLGWNMWISLKIPLKFVPKGPINNIPALVHIMAWCRPGDKPLSEPMMVRLPTHICVTRPQWVNSISTHYKFYNLSSRVNILGKRFIYSIPSLRENMNIYNLHGKQFAAFNFTVDYWLCMRMRICTVCLPSLTALSGHTFSFCKYHACTWLLSLFD